MKKIGASVLGLLLGIALVGCGDTGYPDEDVDAAVDLDGSVQTDGKTSVDTSTDAPKGDGGNTDGSGGDTSSNDAAGDAEGDSAPNTNI